MISWLTSRLPFYNSKSSKPNRSASLFGEAQSDNTKPRSAVTKLRSKCNGLSLSQKRPTTLRQVQQSRCSWGLLQIRVFTPSDAWNSVPIPASAKCIKEQWQSSVWICFSRFKSFVPNLQFNEKYKDYFDVAGATGSNHTPYAFIFFVVGSTFVGTSTSVRTRQSKISCLGLSSRFLIERVWVTQGLPCIPPGVALDKTPSTIWYWRGLKRVRPHLFFLKRTQALGQGPDETSSERARQLGCISQKKR